MSNRSRHAWVAAFLTASALFAQKTTNFTFTGGLTGESNTATGHAVGSGSGNIGALGPVAISLDLTQPVDISNTGNALDDYKGTISFAFNRLDSFDVAITIPNGNGNFASVMGNITGGKGAYQGATGSMGFTSAGLPPSAPRSQALKSVSYALAGNGNITVGGETTALTLSSANMVSAGSRDIFLDTNTGTINVSPLGNAALTVAGSGGDNNTRQTGVATLKFNANDSISFFLNFIGDNPPPTLNEVITGGTGAYAGATGSVTVNIAITPDGKSVTFTGSGAVTTGATGLPVITEVTTAFGPGEIAPNSWTVIKGNNLVPANTPAAGVDWSLAPEFASGKMPTNLQGISVAVNGVPAYVYFYCSAATDKDCATDQINVLTPLDAIGDHVPAAVVVSNGSASSPPFIVNEISFAEPSFLLFSTKGHVVGVHLDRSLLGPTTLYPGLSTPAKVGETVLLFAIGYGIPKGGATQGSATQAGPVQGGVNCRIGNNGVPSVPTNIISPGLAQLNLTIPAGTPSGDNLIFCAGGFPDGSSGHTPVGNLITVQ